MNKIKTLALNKEKITILTGFLVLTGVATLAPFLGNQVITGPIVNAVLFISSALLGVWFSLLVALIPSAVALSVGLLPVVLFPMVPFIIMGNALLVVSFILLKKKGFWLSMISASILKYLFLFASSSVVINLFIKKELGFRIGLMMGLNQLFTALAGGVIAFLFLKSIKKEL